MAKKKTEKPGASSAGGADEPAPAAKKKTVKKTATAASSGAQAKASGSKQPKQPKAPATAPSSMPMIDTALAAQSAAAMLVSRQKREGEPAEKKGSLIQQLKADLNKGHHAAVSSMLDKGAAPGQKKPAGLPFGQKQVGHNQTFGPDVTRSGVPRRTSG